MAFCCRSERKMILSDNQNQLGPGQYLMINDHPPKENKYKYTKLKKNIFTLKKGKEELKNLQLNQSIANQSINNINSLNGSSIISNSTKEYSNNNNNNSSGVFISSEGRFHYIDNKDDIPGPGKYIDIDKENLRKTTQIKKAKNIKNELYKTGQLNRVVSIQSKSMNGYFVDNQNKTLINMKNIINSQSTTSPLIGPGTYNIIDKNKNTQVKWSKPKSNKDSIKNNIMKEIIGDESASLNSTKKNIKYNINDLIHKKMEYLNSISDYKKMMNFNKLYDLVGNVPGPGFYQEEFSFDPIEENERKKINNSEKRRHIYINKDMYNTKKKEVPLNRDTFLYANKSCSDIGPGSYFLPKTIYQSQSQKKLINDRKTLAKYNFGNIKTHKQNKFTNKKVGNNISLGNHMVIKKEDTNNTNNNYYENIHTLSATSKENVQINNIIKSFLLYRNYINRKITNNKKEETPGPGTYFKIDSPTIKDIIKNQHNNITNVFGSNALRCTDLNNNNNVPGVGEYNINEYNSINYNNIVKLNSKRRKNEGYSLSSSRFIINNNINNKVGPTTYNPKFDYNTYNKKNLAPFDINNKRFSDNQYINEVGPGQYNIGNQNWNKKSFNKLFN